MNRLLKRFLNYVRIDTQSNPNSTTQPSTMKQKNLSKLLFNELSDMGYSPILDKYGYTYCHIKKNAEGFTSVGFISHVDTSPDFNGSNVNPKIIKSYDGKKIELNSNLFLDTNSYPILNSVVGDDLVVTDGLSLLGADDKCGVAEIMELAQILSEDTSIKHGDIYICFTPDEEIGKGTINFNYDFFKVNYAFTLDGSTVGEIEYENFNAASANVKFTGKAIHPGSAKNKMVNASGLAIEFHSLLPKKMIPSLTSSYEGFNHLTELKAKVDSALSKYIIRNHDLSKFKKQKEKFEEISKYLNNKYSYECSSVVIKDTYFNMYEKIKPRMDIIEIARKSIEKCGIKAISNPIRGGTDGAVLTYNGLLCPNLGTGGFNFHGPYEFASVQQMNKAVKILLEIIKY